ncbi:hypothetical protein SCP_0103180 [Sparassis crispa]|uniref:BTB domain-containing protein n=1 Tax=Sparassis crispa TaxID=139825 RepID=A0A401G5L6_9APHY|nr:hypothetical protein SCP_0103180 [Sparassis crispa]GBE77443.1 hypothetical protein SCP_0103180 [Sparassis crispa]
MAGRIDAQQSESELTFKFRIENLHALFTLPEGQKEGPALKTDEFGPGLSFKLQVKQKEDEQPALGVFLVIPESLNTPAARINCKLTAHSLDFRTTYFSRTWEHVMRSGGSGRGWPTFLTFPFVQKTQEEALWIRAVVKVSMGEPSVRSNATLTLLHKVMHSREVDALRFVSYEARGASGKLGRPRSTFAPADILTESCENVDSLDKFMEILHGFALDEEGYPANLHDTAASYTGYDSDSDDFDDDDSDGAAIDGRGTKRKFDAIADAKSEDSDGNVEMVDETTVATVKREPFEGKVIVLQDAAARTWEALLFYLQTGFIVFAPLSSSDKQARDNFREKYRDLHPNRPESPSCKSIYRLADKLGLDDLKKRALLHLESQLSPQNILDEIFSEFTSHYEEVRKIELAAVVKWWAQVQKQPALITKMEEVASGKLPHAGKIMIEIWSRVMVKPEDVAKAAAADLPSNSG